LNVLLANPGSHHLTGWEQPSTCKDHTSHDTPTLQVGNYVNATLGNYVNDNQLNLGNSVNADIRVGSWFNTQRMMFRAGKMYEKRPAGPPNPTVMEGTPPLVMPQPSPPELEAEQVLGPRRGLAKTAT
jgi:hypothetical protein